MTPYDQIIFDNRINCELNFYVSKQKDEENNVPTHLQESTYRMALTILENPAERGKTNWNTNVGLYRAVTKLRTNLDYDISDLAAAEGELSTSSRLKTSQMTLTYQSVNKDGAKGIKVSGNSAKKILDCNSLDDRENETVSIQLRLRFSKKALQRRIFRTAS